MSVKRPTDIKKTLSQFDVDEWIEGFKKHPKLYEAKRKALIEATLAKAPEKYQQRLKGLQFQIDMERQRAKTPLAGALKLSSMMWDSVYKLQTQVSSLSENTNSQDSQSDDLSAQILSFNRDKEK